MISRVLVVAILSSLLLASASFAQRGSRGPIFVDYAAPPPTYESLWDKAPVVVRVQIIKSSVVAAGRNKDFPFVEHAARVLEVLKDDGTLGKTPTIFVLQPGGTITAPDGQEVTGHTSGVPLMRESQELVLYLEYLPGPRRFVPSYGPAGVFPIDGDDIEIPSSVRHYPEFQQRARVPKDEVFNGLRQLKSSRK